VQYLDKNDLAKLFRATHAVGTKASQRDHMLMLLQFFTGARVSQALNVRGEDIFERDGKWVVMIRAAKRGNIATHTLHIDSDPAFDMSPLIALAANKGQSLIFGGAHTSNYNTALKTYFEAAGLHSMYAHSHVFRHSAAMVVFDATQRIGAVSQFLAHKSPSSAFVYLRENDSSLAQQAMDELQLV
jgi:integrase